MEHATLTPNKRKKTSQQEESERVRQRTEGRRQHDRESQDKAMQVIQLRNRAQSPEPLIQMQAAKTQAASNAGNLEMVAQMMKGLNAVQQGKLASVGGRGKVASLAQKLQGTSNVTDLTNLLNNLGYSSAQGHHGKPDPTARDINVYKGPLVARGEGNTNEHEQRRLMILSRALRRAFGGRKNDLLKELIFDPWGSYFGPGTRRKSPYGGHQAHLHFRFREGNW